MGDLNGVSAEILLKSHSEAKKICTPLYCTKADMIEQCGKLLGKKVPKDMTFFECGESFEIEPGRLSIKSGRYSYDSFLAAIALAEEKKVHAVCTLPINKEAWSVAGIPYKGHTDALRGYFGREATMVLGTKELFVALYTEHIPLKDVFVKIELKGIADFLVSFYEDFKKSPVAVLGLNPHAGEGGVLGSEDGVIKEAINEANSRLGCVHFAGPFPPDTAFIPQMRKKYRNYVAMYHDQGLAPLKALYFDKSINITLGLPIIRTSVDHGTGFDIAYKNQMISTLSFLNAIKIALALKR